MTDLLTALGSSIDAARADRRAREAATQPTLTEQLRNLLEHTPSVHDEECASLRDGTTHNGYDYSAGDLPCDCPLAVLGQAIKELAAPARTVTLPFTALGLDPADLGFDVDDEHTELYHHDGAFLVVEGFDGSDPDAVRAVAEWFDGISTQAIHLAHELRDLANSICTTCSGTGVVGPDERDCRVCAGFGRLS